MPTYEYRCPDGHRFEKIQKMADKPRAKCPVCGKTAERMISGGAGLVFKGSGFYITDYGKDGKGPRKPAPEPGGSTESKTESKSESKTESKGESKTESKGESRTDAKPETKKESKPATSDTKAAKKPSE